MLCDNYILSNRSRWTFYFSKVFNLILQSAKENLTISNKQRFSIRKFSIGVASVMLGTTLYFMGGVGSSIVHADSVDQPVQTQTSKDINSAQASSDATLAQQDSDQNQSQVSSVQNDEKTTNDQTAVKSSQQATNASAAKSNTQDSKKAVSDTNETKSVANKAQISDQLATATSDKSSQQVEKTDTKNSNTLDIKQNKQRLAGNVKLNALTDNKAQTDTQTNSKYSVTDNYPADLTNYLPSTFKNTQEYAFEWLRTQTGNNIILTTNRTGDGEVYVYQDGKKVGTLAKKSSCSLQDTIEDIFGYDQIKIGTVYNDDYAGIVQSNNGYLLNIIYSSHAKDVDNAGSSYSTVSFFVPHKIKQTVTYKDSKGNVIDRLTHTQYGLTGQSYTTGLPSGPKYVQQHQYLANITQNGSGLISEFGDGYSCTKDYHDGVSVTFTEHDSEKTGIGTMDYVIYEKSGYDDSKKVVQKGSLAYGQSTNYTNDSGRYTIVNPYVPQTTNIVYQYEPLGNVVKTVPGPEGTTTTTTTQYKNDPNDPTKVKSINVPSIPGYTTLVNGKTIMPADPGKDTTITYSANDQSTTAKFVDDDNNGAQVGDTVTLNGKTDQTINTGLKVPDNYELAKDQTLPETYKFKANGNDPIVIHLVHATKPDTNDNNLNKTVTRTINVINPDGNTNTITQVAHLRRSGTIDEVTQKATYTPWITDNWAEYDTPQISGYTPSPAKVLATKVDGNTQNQTVTITYSANDQKASVTYVDDKTGKTLKVDNLNGVTNAKSGYTTKAAIDTYTGLGYTLVSDDTNGNEVVFDNDDANDQAFTVHLSHGTITVTTENPGKPGEPVDPDNPDGPKYPDGTDEYQVKRTGTQTIHYVGAGDKTPADNKQTFVFTREITFDEVTGKIISVTPWNVQSHTFGNVDTPVIPGYHADKAVAGGETVTPDDLNKVITVTYAPDGGSGDNPGSNGGGDQGTTPTSEPVPEPTPSPDDQPDTTLPSDNNTDKDVEKDKQDKPKKVKKARKIIKTRITKQEHIGNAEKAEPLAEQEHNDQTVASPVKNEANEPQLPQTGEANTSVIGLLGMLVAGFAAILGFESSRSRKHKN